MATVESRIERVSRECLAVRVRMLDRMVSGVYDGALRPLGLRTTQMSLLVVLSRMGESTASEVGRILVIEKSTLSRNVERLIERGWVRSSEGDDARQRVLTLTAAGRRKLERALPAWESAQDLVSEALGPGGAGGLLRSVGRIREMTENR